MFRIGDFSKLSNVSIRMLRHYDKLDLLVPEEVDNSSGFRYYSAVQLEKVNKIQKLKSLGFSLAIIKEILEKDDVDHIAGYFEIRQRELKEELEKVTLQTKQLSNIKEILKEDITMMNYNVVLKNIPERKVMSVRKVIPSFSDEGKLWEILYAEFQKQNVKFANPPMGIAIFHDKEYKEQDVDVEIQSSIEGNYNDTDMVKFFTAPEVQVVSVTFHGSYDQMQSVTAAIGKWIEENDYSMTGPMFNIYHVSPSQDPNPDNWVTEACFQVKKN